MAERCAAHVSSVRRRAQAVGPFDSNQSVKRLERTLRLRRGWVGCTSLNALT